MRFFVVFLVSCMPFLACGKKKEDETTNANSGKQTNGTYKKQVTSSSDAKKAAPSSKALKIDLKLSPKSKAKSTGLLLAAPEKDDCSKAGSYLSVGCEFGVTAEEIGKMMSDLFEESTAAEGVQVGSDWEFTRTVARTDSGLSDFAKNDLLVIDCPNDDSKSVEVKSAVLRLKLSQDATTLATTFKYYYGPSTDSLNEIITGSYTAAANSAGDDTDNTKGVADLAYNLGNDWTASEAVVKASAGSLDAFKAKCGATEYATYAAKQSGTIKFAADSIAYPTKYTFEFVDFKVSDDFDGGKAVFEVFGTESESKLTLTFKGNNYGASTSDPFSEKGTKSEKNSFVLGIKDASPYAYKAVVTGSGGDTTSDVKYEACGKVESEAMVDGYFKISSPDAAKTETGTSSTYCPSFSKVTF